MDQVAPQFRAIAARRQAIQGELANLQCQIEALETERTELEVAARVLHRLGLLAEEVGPELPLPTVVSGDSASRQTVPDMIRAVISAFLEAGLPGATGQQVLAEVSRRWGVSDPNIIRPTLWRMVKSDRLDRRGDVYTLPSVSLIEKSASLSPSIANPVLLAHPSPTTNNAIAASRSDPAVNYGGMATQ